MSILFILWGPLMYYLHKKLPSNIKGCHESKMELISDLENILQEGDKVLVKSSKSVGLSSIVDALAPRRNKLSLNVQRDL